MKSDDCYLSTINNNNLIGGSKMHTIKDVGIIKVDCYNNIYRWIPSDRRLISDFLPEGPGWAPEHYITFIRVVEDYCYIKPSGVIHLDGWNDNNDPYNLAIRETIDPKKMFVKNPDNVFKYEFVYNGFFQESISRVISIPRCQVCGIPIAEYLGFDVTSESDVYNDVCPNCNNETLGMIDCILPKVTNHVREVSDNLAIDYNRGLSVEHLFQKYKHIPDLKKVISSSINTVKRSII